MLGPEVFWVERMRNAVDNCEHFVNLFLRGKMLEKILAAMPNIQLLALLGALLLRLRVGHVGDGFAFAAPPHRR
jgi:hypothetical protein